MTDIITVSGGQNLTKSLMQARCAHLVQDAKSGKISALKLFIQAKFITESLALALDELKADAMKEAHSYPKGDRNLLGVSFDLREGQDRIDYMADPEYARLVAAAEARKELLKQASKGKGKTLDPDTGEVLAKLPTKGSSPTIAITFPK